MVLEQGDSACLQSVLYRRSAKIKKNKKKMAPWSVLEDMIKVRY